MKEILGHLLLFMLLLTAYGIKAESRNDSLLVPKAVFGLKAGINISSFSASVNSETRSKLGLNLGMYIKARITDRFFFRPEIYYSNQGQMNNYLLPTSGPSLGSTTTNLDYINLPLLFEQGRKISFQFGPQFGLLLSGSEKGTVSSTTVDNDLKKVMNNVDLGLVVGVGISPSKRFNCGIRFNFGLNDIFDRTNQTNSPVKFPQISNRVFHFYIATSF
jgi:hypothetical protein